MRDIFIEDSAKVKNESKQKSLYNSFTVLAIFFFVVAFIVFSYIITTTLDKLNEENILLFILLYCLPCLIALGIGIVFWLLRNKFYVEYDYSFTSGAFRVSKVIMNKKRKFVVKFDISEVEKVGEIDSETYKNYLKINTNKKILLTNNKTPMDGKAFYYFAVKQNKTKNIYIFECKKEFIIQIVNYKGRYILDKDFKWFI